MCAQAFSSSLRPQFTPAAATPSPVRLSLEDRGRGVAPSPDGRDPGLGLSLIVALTAGLQISHGAGDRGSRVAMWFAPRPIEAT
jgi:hypothetical protein